MKTIEVVFTKSKKKLPIGSWLIRLWTWKPYSHVAYRFWGKNVNGYLYYQANDGKVNIEHHDWFVKKHEIVNTHEMVISSEEFKELTKRSYRYLGQNYGILQNLGIALIDVLKLFKIYKKNPFIKGVNCSEIIYNVLLYKYDKKKLYEKDNIKPHHIERLITKYDN